MKWPWQPRQTTATTSDSGVNLAWARNWRRMALADNLALATVAALAAALRLVNLGALGLGNIYYAAAITSMLQSWRNAFFVAAEPGGSVSVDKPPLGFWVQALSARLFGVNGPALILPQVIAGVLSVVLLQRLVRRGFGKAAGLLSAVVLAVTPIAVAVDRNNTVDSLLILILLLAAWGFIQATETGRWRPLLLGAALVGVGVNVKMLQAILPLPAFYALYLAGAGGPMRRKLGRLAAATALLGAISLSWVVIVDLTSADQRPYVGGSGDNSAMSLMIGYNGIDRLLGLWGPRGAAPPVGRAPAGPTLPSGARPLHGTIATPGGAGAIGRPGVGRLFIPPLSKEISWLLPFGLASAVMLLMGSRWRWPLAPTHQAIVLWGGWLLAGGAVFSMAGFLHEYYLAMLAPPLAALVGMGGARLWLAWENRPRLTALMAMVAMGSTAALQAHTARAYIGEVMWLPLVWTAFSLGAAALIASAARRQQGMLAAGGFGLLLGAMLATPMIWSALTAFYARSDQPLPSAYDGQAALRTENLGERAHPAVLDYVTARAQDTRYLLAAPSALQGAPYVLATGRPVLYVGGFNGSDAVITAKGLEAMVCRGELRYMLGGALGGATAYRPEIAAWIEEHGAPAPGLPAAAGAAAPLLYACGCGEPPAAGAGGVSPP